MPPAIKRLHRLSSLKAADLQNLLRSPLLRSSPKTLVREKIKQLRTEITQLETEIVDLRRILSQFSEAIAVLDSRNTLLYVNPAWERLTGHKFDSVVGKNCTIIFSKTNDPALYKKIQSALKRGEPFTTEQLKLEKADGTEYLTHSTFFRISRGRKPPMNVHFHYDITSYQQTEEAHLRFASLVEWSNDAIIGTNLKGIITSWNPAAEKLYGYNKEEALGKHIQMIIPKKDKYQYSALIKRLKAGQPIKSFETTRERKDGQLVDVSLTISLIKNSEGKVTGFSSIGQDITERKKIQDKLKLFSQVIEEAPDGIQITDRFGNIIYSNHASKRIYGFSQKEMLGKNVNGMNADPKIAEKVIIPALKKCGHWQGELLIKHKKDHTFPIWLTTSVVRNEAGRVFALVGIIRDITEMKRLEELKKEFLSVAAHELKTPITTLKLMSQAHLLKYKRIGADQLKIEELQLMDRELDRLTRLINDILDNQRIETGKLNLRFEKINLPPLINEVAEQIKVIYPEYKIISERMPVKISVVADFDRIKQVLTNLLSNAVKYSPKNSKITIKAQKVGKEVKVSVKDQGLGIPKDKLKLIFDRFYQAKEKSNGGFGLGLYIAKEIIEMHGGKIWAKSKTGQGSTFFFTLPTGSRNLKSLQA